MLTNKSIEEVEHNAKIKTHQPMTGKMMNPYVSGMPPIYGCPVDMTKIICSDIPKKN